MRASLAILAALLAGSVLSCSKPSSGPAPAPASSTPAAPTVDTDSFHAELKAPGPFKKGEPATFVVRVQAKAPFHINDEYPAKFKPGDAPGAKYAEARLERQKQADAFATEPCSGGTDACVLNITVKFTPETSGTVRLGGTVDVSVCNKDQCLIDKKPLEVSVSVP